MDRGSCRGGFQTRPGATDADHEGAHPLTSQTIPRGGRMTRRTSRERFLPKQGGFETRPYKSPDLGAAMIASIAPDRYAAGNGAGGVPRSSINSRRQSYSSSGVLSSTAPGS